MSSVQTARIAFVGAGNHATESLYPNIAHIPEFDLAAVCDLAPEKAEYAARKYGAPAWFTDVETMLDRVQPQGVCICGQPSMHYDVGMQVLRRGIPIFIEKAPGAHACAGPGAGRCGAGAQYVGHGGLYEALRPGQRGGEGVYGRSGVRAAGFHHADARLRPVRRVAPHDVL